LAVPKEEPQHAHRVLGVAGVHLGADVVRVLDLLQCHHILAGQSDTRASVDAAAPASPRSELVEGSTRHSCDGPPTPRVYTPQRPPPDRQSHTITRRKAGGSAAAGEPVGDCHAARPSSLRKRRRTLSPRIWSSVRSRWWSRSARAEEWVAITGRVVISRTWATPDAPGTRTAGLPRPRGLGAFPRAEAPVAAYRLSVVSRGSSAGCRRPSRSRSGSGC